jgi:hypothetical protein
MPHARSMHGFPILPWLALVAVYLATGRARGSSWWSLALLAGGVFAAVFLEFTLLFTLGPVGLLASVFATAACLSAEQLRRQLVRKPAGASTARPSLEPAGDGVT